MEPSGRQDRPAEIRSKDDVAFPESKVCLYEMSELLDDDVFVIHQGQAIVLTMNASGILLLMPQAPELNQCLEMTFSSPVKRLKLGDVKSIRRLRFDTEHPLYVVRVRFYPCDSSLGEIGGWG